MRTLIRKSKSKSKTKSETFAGLRTHIARATLAIVLVIVVAAPCVARAQGEGPIVLRLPASARVAAMANAGLSSTDADVLFYNPAMVNTARGIAGSAQTFGSHATAASFASVTPMGSVNVAFGVQYLHWKSPTLSYAELVSAGAAALFDTSNTATLNASSSAFTMSLANVIRGKRVGASIKYLDERVGTSQANSVAIDIGYVMPLGPGIFSAVAANVGADGTFANIDGRLPMHLGVGWGAGLSPKFLHWDFGYQTQVAILRDGFIRAGGGVELGYVPVDGVGVVVRLGARSPREHAESFATAGLGITIDRFSLDYALEPFRDGLPASHRIGARVR